MNLPELINGARERFEAHGHVLLVTRNSKTGQGYLLCSVCGESALVAVVNRHGGWYIPETALDLKCEGGE